MRRWPPRPIAIAPAISSAASYLGHSSIQMTFDRYGHLMPGNESEAAELLNAYLRRSSRAGASDES